MRRSLLVLATSLGAVLTALVASLVLVPAAQAATTTTSSARVVRWLDGDTVLTSRGTVRLIGIDTPERGRCGHLAATRNAERLAPPRSTVRLTNPAGVRDRDAYGRSLRFLDRGAVDVAAAQVVAGAAARYDGVDGYDRHVRQARYRRLDAAHANYRCVPAAAPSGVSGGVSGPVPPAGRGCPSYAPIKGNASSMIYHRPGQQYYAVTVPEECFRDAASAVAAGYRAARV